MGNKFLNPLIDDYVDKDDPEFGLQSLEDVDTERSFSPEVTELYKHFLEQEIPEDNQAQRDALHRLKQERRERMRESFQRMNVGGASMTDVERSILNNPKLEAFTNRPLDKESVPFLGQQEPDSVVKENAQPSKIGAGFENRPSMKPIWNKKEERKRDQVNLEALKRFLSGK